MNPRVSNQKTAALTLVEVLVVICVIAVLVALLLPAKPRYRPPQQGQCVQNLKQIGIAYLVWADDHNGKFPMQVSVTNGGTMESNNGRNAWLNFLVMSNELNTPKLLVCPQDKEDQPPANEFSWQLAGHVSYFVGLDASKNHPHMFLSGDDSLAIGGVPVKSCLLELSTNAPITWTEERHFFSGNIVFADGNVEMLPGYALTNSLQQTSVATNRLAIP
jgi:prepilin-type processing-associated H-X9-DG protein